jgi:outer membrane receptor protein involved in Fe transport
MNWSKTFFPIKLILVFIVFSSQILLSQQGILSGKVVDASTGEELIGVNIILEGTRLGAATDIDGNYQIKSIPAGQYTLAASMIGYNKLTVTNVLIKPDEITKLELSLQTSTYELNEIVVSAEILLNNEAGLLKNRQKSISISDAISSEQLSKSGASDVGDAMKKVVGSTVIDGKYVFVRGLGDRYSSTQLNGAELPSTDPNKKSFQLDLISTSLLDNIITLKTFTPDKPGNFSGGIVDIGTKKFPDKFTLKISGNSSYNSQTSFNSNFIGYNGGNTDWLGFDDGTRNIPGLLENPDIQIPIKQAARFDGEKAKTLNEVSRSFNSVMDVNKISVPVNQSISISMGDNLKTGYESSFGYLGSVTYSRNFSFYDNGTVGRYTVSDLNADELNPQLLVSDMKGTQEANIGGLVTLAYNLNPNQQIGGNVFYSKSGISLARSQEGKWPQEFGNNPDAPVYYNKVLSWIERDLISYQLRGQHFIEEFLAANIDWSVSLSNTTQDEPDYRLLSYSIGQTANGPNYIISGSGFDNPSRYFRTLEDNSQNYTFDLSIPFNQWSDLSAKFKTGVFYQNTERTFRERIFSYDVDNKLFNDVNGNLADFFSEENIGIISVDTLGGSTIRYNFGNVIRDNSKKKNNYDGTLKVFATYGMIELPIFSDLKFVGGVRYEITDMNLISQDTTYKAGKINEQDILPSVNLIYSINQDMNLRFSATQTLARPNFREVAPYSTKEFINDVELQGNPNLRRTLITNFDLRWEWFTKPGELIALSGFYKKMKDPIELSYAEGSIASNPIVQFKNVDKATIAGLEFEFRFGLGVFDDLLSNFFIGSNLSLIYSNIDISQSELNQRLAIDSSSSRTRHLQGQSPFVLNIDLTYQNDQSGTSAGLYFNTFGERLSKVSANVNPDVYEQPAPILNFSASQKIFNQLILSLAVKNLLNSDYREVSRFKGNDYTFIEYKTGITYSLGVSYGL